MELTVSMFRLISERKPSNTDYLRRCRPRCDLVRHIFFLLLHNTIQLVDGLTRQTTSGELMPKKLAQEAFVADTSGTKLRFYVLFEQVMIWDTRSKDSPEVIDAHNAAVNCLTFSPMHENMLATGSADATIALWDLRNLKRRLHTLEGHLDQVFNVAWSPASATILASCSADRRVNIWDLQKIGAEVRPEEREDGAPELIFVHGGHTDKISDFSWNSQDTMMIASVSDNNFLQIWKAAANVTEIGENMSDDMLE